MSVDSSWFSQIEHEWAQLRQDDLSLDVERFFRHVVLERIGPDRHPSLRVALALSLVTETGAVRHHRPRHSPKDAKSDVRRFQLV